MSDNVDAEPDTSTDVEQLASRGATDISPDEGETVAPNSSRFGAIEIQQGEGETTRTAPSPSKYREREQYRHGDNRRGNFGNNDRGQRTPEETLSQSGSNDNLFYGNNRDNRDNRDNRGGQGVGTYRGNRNSPNQRRLHSDSWGQGSPTRGHSRHGSEHDMSSKNSLNDGLMPTGNNSQLPPSGRSMYSIQPPGSPKTGYIHNLDNRENSSTRSPVVGMSPAGSKNDLSQFMSPQGQLPPAAAGMNMYSRQGQNMPSHMQPPMSQMMHMGPQTGMDVDGNRLSYAMMSPMQQPMVVMMQPLGTGQPPQYFSAPMQQPQSLVYNRAYSMQGPGQMVQLVSPSHPQQQLPPQLQSPILSQMQPQSPQAHVSSPPSQAHQQIQTSSQQHPTSVQNLQHSVPRSVPYQQPIIHLQQPPQQQAHQQQTHQQAQQLTHHHHQQQQQQNSQDFSSGAPDTLRFTNLSQHTTTHKSNAFNYMSRDSNEPRDQYPPLSQHSSPQVPTLQNLASVPSGSPVVPPGQHQQPQMIYPPYSPQMGLSGLMSPPNRPYGVSGIPNQGMGIQQMIPQPQPGSMSGMRPMMNQGQNPYMYQQPMPQQSQVQPPQLNQQTSSNLPLIDHVKPRSKIVIKDKDGNVINMDEFKKIKESNPPSKAGGTVYYPSPASSKPDSADGSTSATPAVMSTNISRVPSNTALDTLVSPPIPYNHFDNISNGSSVTSGSLTSASNNPNYTKASDQEKSAQCVSQPFELGMVGEQLETSNNPSSNHVHVEVTETVCNMLATVEASATRILIPVAISIQSATETIAASPNVVSDELPSEDRVSWAVVDEGDNLCRQADHSTDKLKDIIDPSSDPAFSSNQSHNLPVDIEPFQQLQAKVESAPLSEPQIPYVTPISNPVSSDSTAKDLELMSELSLENKSHAPPFSAPAHQHASTAPPSEKSTKYFPPIPSSNSTSQTYVIDKKGKKALKSLLANADSKDSKRDVLDAYMDAPTVETAPVQTVVAETQINDEAAVVEVEPDLDDDWEKVAEKIEQKVDPIEPVARRLAPGGGKTQSRLNSGPINSQAKIVKTYTRDDIMKMKPTTVPPRPQVMEIYVTAMTTDDNGDKRSSGSSTPRPVPLKGYWSFETKTEGQHKDRDRPENRREGGAGSSYKHENRDQRGGYQQSQQQFHQQQNQLHQQHSNYSVAPPAPPGDSTGWKRGEVLAPLPPAQTPNSSKRGMTPRAPMERPTKVITDPTVQLSTDVLAVLNKITPQTFDKLTEKLCDIPIATNALLNKLIELVYEKAIQEQNFSNLYADMCSALERKSRYWSFLQVVYHRDEQQYFWMVDLEIDTELVGPFSCVEDCEAMAISSETLNPQTVSFKPNVESLVVSNEILIKIFKNVETSEYYFSYTPFPDLNKELMSPSTFPTKEEAMKDASKKNSFRRRLVWTCQQEFLNSTAMEGKYAALLEYETWMKSPGLKSLSADERAQQTAEWEEKRFKLKRRMLGNIRFIGELYKKGMIVTRIMHDCVVSLIGRYEAGEWVGWEEVPDDQNLEILIKLLPTVGQTMELKATADNAHLMNWYFDQLRVLSKNKKINSRIRFGLEEVIQMREKNWESRRKEEGPVKIQEIHQKIAEEEFLKQQQMLNQQQRGSGVGVTGGRGYGANSPHFSVARVAQTASGPASQSRGDIRPDTTSRPGDIRSSRGGYAERDAPRTQPTPGILPIQAGVLNSLSRDSFPTSPSSSANYGAIDSKRAFTGPAPSLSPRSNLPQITGAAPFPRHNDIKKRVVGLIEEYIRLKDVSEVRETLRELTSASCGYFIQEVLAKYLDTNNKDIMATLLSLVYNLSDLLAAAHGIVEEGVRSFEPLLLLKDTLTDNMDASNRLGEIIGHLVRIGACELTVVREIMEACCTTEKAEDQFVSVDSLKETYSEFFAAVQRHKDNTS